MDPLKQPLRVVCFLYIIQSLKSEMTVTRHLTVIRKVDSNKDKEAHCQTSNKQSTYRPDN
jgi:hypothetical protein